MLTKKYDIILLSSKKINLCAGTLSVIEASCFRSTTLTVNVIVNQWTHAFRFWTYWAMTTFIFCSYILDVSGYVSLKDVLRLVGVHHIDAFNNPHGLWTEQKSVVIFF